MPRPSLPRITLGTFLVVFCIALGLAGSAMLTQQVIHDVKLRRMRNDIENVQELAMEQEATIQALAHEVEQLRGELKGAMERLEAAKAEAASGPTR